MILKRVTSTDHDNFASIAQCLDCTDCIHETVCKWRDKCLKDYPNLISVPAGFPFIEINFSCSEFKRKEPAKDLSGLTIERIEATADQVDLNPEATNEE